MFSNFVVCLLIILAIFYIIEFMYKKENFVGFVDQNIYESIGSVPRKTLYFPRFESDIDYQANLNDISGYDAGTRGYDNPLYAMNVARGLNTN